MGPRTAPCPACGTALDTTAFAVGAKIRCGQCGNVMLVPGDVPPPVPRGPGPAVFAARRRAASTTHLYVLGVLAALFCCLPGGVLALVYAGQASSKAQRGDSVGARAAAGVATTWLWISVFTLPALLGVAVATGVVSLQEVANWRPRPR